ncbi:uncharacterized protein BO97DRAFT_454637, partial [Aspergillus homomorphus CBS 101889]
MESEPADESPTGCGEQSTQCGIAGCKALSPESDHHKRVDALAAEVAKINLGSSLSGEAESRRSSHHERMDALAAEVRKTNVDSSPSGDAGSRHPGDSKSGQGSEVWDTISLSGDSEKQEDKSAEQEDKSAKQKDKSPKQEAKSAKQADEPKQENGFTKEENDEWIWVTRHLRTFDTLDPATHRKKNSI